MSKLNGQLARTEQQAQQATVKKTREGLLNWHQKKKSRTKKKRVETTGKTSISQFFHVTQQKTKDLVCPATVFSGRNR